ncbi:MAG: imidazole glycerol phosphate synthase subunit HisH, partial [Chitinophagaceae bacterium]|nr:imidazole glycerol phosphate synthase subunit HisH [Chitinophagaceae bacterium]
MESSDKIVIVKYNAGNVQSVLYALERIGVQATVSDDHAAIVNADRVIFPGVGEASTAMRYLRERGLDKVIGQLKQPVLGICLGMQLMCAYTEENDTECIGIFNEKVRLFVPGKAGEKVPQVGWNNIFNLKSPLLNGIAEHSYIYSVHSYFASVGTETIATADYVFHYSAGLNKNNFYGVQFHPEKSAATGEQILKNFINIQH